MTCAFCAAEVVSLAMTYVYGCPQVGASARGNRPRIGPRVLKTARIVASDESKVRREPFTRPPNTSGRLLAGPLSADFGCPLLEREGEFAGHYHSVADGRRCRMQGTASTGSNYLGCLPIF
jgi:hypothetical protein